METNAKFVLLVEKDTVFEKLIQQEVMRKFEGHCIMVTVSKLQYSKWFLDVLIKILF